MGAAVLVWTPARRQRESKTSSFQAALTHECECCWRGTASVHWSLHPAGPAQGKRGGRRHKPQGSGAEPAALACLQCLDLRHFPITRPAVAHEAPSQNTQRVLTTVIAGRKWQERKGVTGITTREQGPGRTAAISESSNTSTALLGLKRSSSSPRAWPASSGPLSWLCPPCWGAAGEATPPQCHSAAQPRTGWCHHLGGTSRNGRGQQ